MNKCTFWVGKNQNKYVFDSGSVPVPNRFEPVLKFIFLRNHNQKKRFSSTKKWNQNHNHRFSFSLNRFPTVPEPDRGSTISHSIFVNVHLFIWKEVQNTFQMNLVPWNYTQREGRNGCCNCATTNAHTVKPKGIGEKLMPDSESTGSKTPTHYFSRIYLAPGRAGGGGGTLGRAQGPGGKAGKVHCARAGPLVGP